jgi:3-oxoacyl-[acyl-carrier-protein] synthase-3
MLATFDPDMAKLAGVRGPEFCRMTCLEALASAKLSIEQVDLFVCNQSMSWFADACRRSLDLPEHKLVQTFDDLANIGGAAIFVNIDAARRQRRVKRGDVVLIYSPAAGFTRTASVVRWA